MLEVLRWKIFPCGIQVSKTQVAKEKTKTSTTKKEEGRDVEKRNNAKKVKMLRKETMQDQQ